MTVSVLTALIVMLEPLVLIVLGSAWEGLIVPLKILLVGGWFVPLYTLGIKVLRVKDQTTLVLKRSFMRVLVISSLVLMSLHRPLDEIAGIMVTAYLVLLTLMSRDLRRNVNYLLREQCVDVLPSVLCAAVFIYAYPSVFEELKLGSDFSELLLSMAFNFIILCLILFLINQFSLRRSVKYLKKSGHKMNIE